MIRKDKKQWLCLLALAGGGAWVTLFYWGLSYLRKQHADYAVHFTATNLLLLLMPVALGLALGLPGRRLRLHITPAYLLAALLCLLPVLLYIGAVYSWPLFPRDLFWLPRFMIDTPFSAWGPWCGLAAGFWLTRGLLAAASA